MKKTILLAVAAVIMAACCKENEVLEEGPKYITIEARMAGESRTASKEAFVNGDKISIYAWTGGCSSLPQEYVLANVINTFNGTNWKTNEEMMWKDDNTPHYFMGIYSKREITDTDYTLSEDGDILVAHNFGANNGGVSPTSNPVALQFKHLMGKLRVNLKFRTEWETIPTISYVKTSAISTGTIDWLTPKVTPKETAASCYALTATTVNVAYESLMIPQTCSNIVISLEDKTYTYTGSITIEAGKVTTYNLTIGRDKIVLGEVTVTDWKTAPEINGGEAEEEF